MPTIDDVADYIIVRMDEARVPLNVLKFQKLLYYTQAWYLAFHRATLFNSRFQAWIHGPVSRQLYDRFAYSKSLYSPVGKADIRPGFDPNVIAQPDRAHIDAVLTAYANFSGDQLEDLTHNEEPWTLARTGFSANERCEVEIDEGVMRDFYAARGNA